MTARAKMKNEIDLQGSQSSLIALPINHEQLQKETA